VAQYDGATGALTLWTSHQSPHVVRSLLAELLSLPEQDIRVIPPDIGGGFGIKLHMYPEDLVVAWAARRFGRPVKWVQRRTEDLQTNVYCRDHRITVEVAASEDGCIEAMRARVVTNAGAYSILPFGSTLEATGAARQILGPYRIGSYAYEATAVVSNTQPRGAYRGVAMVTTTLAMERMMDLLAVRLDLDPAEVRRRNLIANAEFPYTNALGVGYEGASFVESLRVGLRELGYEPLREEQSRARAAGRHIGIGISCYAEFTAASAKALLWRGIIRVPGFDATTVRVDPSGVVRVYTSSVAMGQGLETALAQLVADELGVDLASIRVSCGDSTLAPYGSGSWGSRAAVVGGGATILAARKVRDKALAIAAQRLEAPAADLELKNGQCYVKGAPFRSVPFAEIARQAYMVSTIALPDGLTPGLDVTEYYDPPIQTISNGVHLAVVETDIDTGVTRLLRYLVVHDCGTVINPLIVDGQVHGGVAQGVGEAFGEAARYDAQGQLLTSTFMDYPLPRADDFPERFDIVHLETPSPLTVGGIKGMGEGGTIGAVAAVVNAVADALRPFGASVTHIPITPEDVWRAVSRGIPTTQRTPS
jgi:carbon-monoxide dehydrogenase large subunit